MNLDSSFYTSGMEDVVSDGGPGQFELQVQAIHNI